MAGGADDSKSPNDSTADAPSRGALLVVDDSELNRMVLAQELTGHGYAVTSAAGGREALALVAERAFDLILLDHMMPEMSGLEVLAALRQTHAQADLPVIMVTARDSSDDVVEALQAGANDYVTKPLDFAVGVARIETQLALKRAKDEVGALNQRLVQAQERIAELVESASTGTQDVDAWAASMAKQIATSIGADAVEVSLIDDGDPQPPPTLRSEAIVADLREAVQSGQRLMRDAHSVLPVMGPSGRPYGAIVVGRKSGAWSRTDRRLVDSFAHQLGGSLELSRMRERLAEAAEQRRVRQQEMLDQGVDLLRICPDCGRCYDQGTDRCEADDAALPDPRSFPYRVAGRYRLAQICGEGGMGMVFRAFDERLDRPVAVKVIRAEHFNNANVRHRFDQEARAVARIDHAGVIAVYDSGELDDGSAFIVMEWLDGCDLDHMLAARGRGSPAEVAELLRQAGAALSAAGEANLVHRDIKPGNIFLVPGERRGFRVKLLDFGVAKQLATDTGLTQTGALIGTPRYMSPEQLTGHAVDPRSDLYSLAAVVYEALTGQRIVDAEDFAEVVMTVIQAMPPPVSSFLTDASAELDDGFAAALAKARDERPESARRWAVAMAAELDRLPPSDASWLSEAGQLRV